MKKRTLTNDLLLIFAVLLAALFLFFVQRNERKTGSWAVVAVNGVEVARYSLLKDETYSLNGGTNTVSIKDGKVSMQNARCPDKLCVKQGWIKYTGQCITCLPNKLTVTVTGGDSSVDIVF